MNIPFKPEEILAASNSSATRVKVPGGWLVTMVLSGRGAFEMTTTFIVDPKWEWTVDDTQSSGA